MRGAEEAKLEGQQNSLNQGLTERTLTFTAEQREEGPVGLQLQPCQLPMLLFCNPMRWRSSNASSKPQRRSQQRAVMSCASLIIRCAQHVRASLNKQLNMHMRRVHASMHASAQPVPSPHLNRVPHAQVPSASKRKVTRGTPWRAGATCSSASWS